SIMTVSFMIRRLGSLAIGTLLSFSRPSPVMGQASWLAAVGSAREEHAVEVRGWLKLVGLESLHSGDNGLGSASDSQVRLPVPAAAHLMVLRLEVGGRLLLLPPTGARVFP